MTYKKLSPSQWTVASALFVIFSGTAFASTPAVRCEGILIPGVHAVIAASVQAALVITPEFLQKQDQIAARARLFQVKNDGDINISPEQLSFLEKVATGRWDWISSAEKLKYTPFLNNLRANSAPATRFEMHQKNLHQGTAYLNSDNTKIERTWWQRKASFIFSTAKQLSLNDLDFFIADLRSIPNDQRLISLAKSFGPQDLISLSEAAAIVSQLPATDQEQAWDLFVAQKNVFDDSQSYSWTELQALRSQLPAELANKILQPERYRISAKDYQDVVAQGPDQLIELNQFLQSGASVDLRADQIIALLYPPGSKDLNQAQLLYNSLRVAKGSHKALNEMKKLLAQRQQSQFFTQIKIDPQPMVKIAEPTLPDTSDTLTNQIKKALKVNDYVSNPEGFQDKLNKFANIKSDIARSLDVYDFLKGNIAITDQQFIALHALIPKGISYGTEKNWNLIQGTMVKQGIITDDWFIPYLECPYAILSDFYGLQKITKVTNPQAFADFREEQLEEIKVYYTEYINSLTDIVQSYNLHAKKYNNRFFGPDQEKTIYSLNDKAAEAGLKQYSMAFLTPLIVQFQRMQEQVQAFEFIP